MRGQIVVNPRKGRCATPGDARGRCRCHLSVYFVCSAKLGIWCSSLSPYSKWRHDSAPMNQNSTAAHRSGCAADNGNSDTALWPPDYPDRDSDRYAIPVILAMKIRHLNSRQMVSVPEQRVTVRYPVLKAPPGEMRHTAEFMNRPPADQPPRKSLCSAAAGRPHSARADHWVAVTSATIFPAFLHSASPPATSGNTPPAHRRYSRRENIFPPPAFSLTKPHDSAGAHRRACARIADSVSVMGFTAKVC